MMPPSSNQTIFHGTGVSGPNLFGVRMELSLHPDRKQALRDWQELERRIQSDSISCSWEWTSGWIRHFGGIVPHEVLVAREQGIVRGMSLLTYPEEVEGPFTVRTVHLGAAGEPDQDSLCVEYNRLLVEELYRGPMMRGLLNRLSEDESWDQLQFDGLAEEEAKVLIELEPDFQLRFAESPYCNLVTTGEPLLKRFGQTSRRDLRRKLNHWGALEVTWAETVTQGREIYEELIQMHQARWISVGLPGSFASDQFRSFHWEMIERLLPQGKVSLVRTRSGGTTVGCVLSYIERGTLLFYQMGANCEHLKMSPGLIAIYACMEEASRRGYERFDFLAGAGEHKRRLSTDSNRLVWANYQRPSMKMKLIQNLRRAKRMLSQE